MAEPFLKHREREVLALVAEGYQNKEIAARLNVVTQTVKFHVHALFVKFGVKSRQELICKVCRDGGGGPRDERC